MHPTTYYSHSCAYSLLALLNLLSQLSLSSTSPLSPAFLTSVSNHVKAHLSTTLNLSSPALSIHSSLLNFPKSGHPHSKKIFLTGYPPIR